MPVIPATWESEIAVLPFEASPDQKKKKNQVGEILSQKQAVGVVAHICYYSYTGGVGRWIGV
jgi:hypothetical protein